MEAGRVRAVVTNAEGIEKVGNFEGLKFLAETSAATMNDTWLDFDAGLKSSSKIFDAPKTKSDEPGILYFTSATTGEPKMVLHTQASYGLGHRLTGELWLDCKPGELHWNISDLGWGKAAWSSFYGPWQMGAAVFALDARAKFDSAQTLDTLADYPVNTFCAPPTALRAIIRQDLTQWKFPHLRHCVTAGEPLNPEVFKIWKEATGLTLYEAYGQTETVALIGNFRSAGLPIKPGSMGLPTPGFTIGLLDEDLNEVPAGKEGEIAVRVKPERPVGIFREYLRNPEGMLASFRGDWYLTGDRARRDADGYFYFIGRKDDVIKSAGYRIGPFEVESTLMEHPSVLDVAVVGKPDALRGQIVKAFVVLRPEVAGSDHLRHTLQQHCKKTTAPFKYPREIEFVKTLPKTTSGKIRRFKLRDSPPHEAHSKGSGPAASAS